MVTGKKKQTQGQEEPLSPVKAGAKKLGAKAQYSRAELIRAAFSFGAKQEDMAGMVHLAGQDTMTKAEAKSALQQYYERKVR